MMETKTRDSVDVWKPTTRAWGTLAYEETTMRFPELVTSSTNDRSQAFALWALAHDSSLHGDALNRFGGGCGDQRPSSDQIDAARSALGIAAPETEPAASSQASKPAKRAKKSRKTTSRRTASRKTGKQLSPVEKAILAQFDDASKLITAYEEARDDLDKARADLQVAADKLRAVDPEKARLLAQFDERSAAVLKELGILPGSGPQGDWMRQ